MKTFKRIIALLCVLLISSAFPVSGSAAGTPAVKANSVSVYKGSSVSVTVLAADFASVASFDLEIHYDSDAFTLNSTSKGSFMSGCSASVNSNTAGVVVVSAVKPDGISGSGTLLTLNFTAKSDSSLQTYPITVAVGEAYDVSLNAVSIASSSGSITVTERPVSVVNYYLGISPSVSSLKCGEITTLTVKNNYNRSFVSADFTVEYDSSMFEVDQVVLNNALKTVSAVYSVNTAIKGIVKISYATTTAVSTYNLFTVSLKAISDINASSKITAAVSNAYSDSETAYNGSTVSCTLSLSKIPEQVVLPKLYFTAQRADFGQSFTASLYVEENSEVAAGDFVLTYDKTVLECQSVRASEDTDGMIVINPNHSDGQIRFSYVNEAECTKNEKWLEITFRPLRNDVHYTFGSGGYGVVDAEMNSVAFEYESFTDCIYTVSTVLPDCINQGYDCFTCHECGKSFNDNYVDPLGHNMGAWYTVTAPTCTVKGQEKRDCSRCDYSEERDIAPTNHTGKYTVERTEPTCTESGFEEGVYCPDCKTWLSGHGVIDKLGHDFTESIFDEAHLKTPATCTDKAVYYYDCSRCAEISKKDTYETGEPLGHNMGAWYTVTAPTCTVKGTEKRDCSRCEHSEERDIAPTNHAGKYTVERTEPTCTESGFEEGVYCPDCETWLSGHGVIDKLGHDFTEKLVDEAHLKTPATCTDKAVYYYDCSRCDEISKADTYEYGTSLGHDMGAWYTVTAPTCTVKGTEKRDCSRCTYDETRDVAPTNHAGKYTVERTEPTCTESGFEEGVYCPDCETWLSGHGVIDKLGHDFTESIVDEAHLKTPATCTDKAVYYYDCSRCDEISKKDTYEHGEPLGHNMGEWYTVTAPTCTEKGTEKRDCSRCTYNETRDVAPTNHAGKYTVERTEPTCTESGFESGVYCPDCKTWLSGHGVIDKLGHDFTEKLVDEAHLKTPATCTDKAVYYYDCSRCAEISKKDTYETGDPLGHNMGAWYTETAPTCTVKGTEKRDCSRCTYDETRDVAPTNHAGKYTVERTEPTCTESGFEEGVYCPDCKTWLSGHGVIAKFGHKIVTDKAVSPTCTKPGKTEGSHCSVCGTVLTEQRTVSATGHTYKTTKTLATTSKDGKTVTACTVCGFVSKSTPIYKASSIKLSATAYTYNGKVQKPTVTVKNSKGTTLKNGTDYTVSYASGCKSVGKYAVTVTLKGNYSGSKTLYFTILPRKTSSLTASQTTTSVKATWKAVTGASGYSVTLYNSGNKVIKTVDTTKTTYTFSKLSAGTVYKVKVTAYKTIAGKKMLSSVYTLLTTATKPGTPTLKVTAGSKKATLSWNKQTGATGYVVYMATSKNGKYTKIATVKGNGSVKFTKSGLTKGKTYYFKVAAYETVGGKTVYGSFSSVKYAKVK